MATDTSPNPIVLRSRRDATLAVQALTHRAEDLEKLAKKNDDEGYGREARTQRADASAIKDLILPAFREQGELPLITTEQIRAGIANGLRDVIHGMLIVRSPEEKQEDALQSREEKLLERLAVRVEGYAFEVAEQAYQAGYSARANEPAVILQKALEGIGGGL